MKIAVLGDIHFDPSPTVAGRRGEIGDIILRKAVDHVNRRVKPDVTVMLGDLVDAGDSPDCAERLQCLRKIMDDLRSPTITIPGNHDPDAERLYAVFDKPPDLVDIKGVRFLPFNDPPEPEFNARRIPGDLDRMRKAREGFAGPIVTLQHVPLFPAGASDCPFFYVNAEEIIAVMREEKIKLAVSGHFHKGVDLISNGELAFVVAPALCESPFAFLEIRMEDDDSVRQVRHQIKIA